MNKDAVLIGRQLHFLIEHQSHFHYFCSRLLDFLWRPESLVCHHILVLWLMIFDLRL